MIYSMAAIFVALIHACFVVFVIAGGLIGLRWQGVLWVHAPVAIYGIMIMVVGWTCPLTTLEIDLRRKAGEDVQWTEFLHHYLFRHLDITGSEWFVIVALVVAIVAFNFYPYKTALV